MKIPIIAVLSGLLIAFIIYVTAFNGGSLSKDSDHWEAFGAYMGFAVSLCSLGMFIYLTTQIHSYNINNDRPIISFIAYENEGYGISNVGRGAAINCRVSYDSKDIPWSRNYIFHHIVTNSPDKILPDSNPTKNIICNYFDNGGNEYITYMKDDTLSIIDFKKIRKKDREIIALWRSLPKDHVHFPRS